MEKSRGAKLTWDRGLPFEDVDPEAAAFFDATWEPILRSWMRPHPLSVTLSDELVRATKCGAKESWVHDKECRGLVLRLRPSGARGYYFLPGRRRYSSEREFELEYDGPNRKFIGDASIYTVSHARKAVEWLANGGFVLGKAGDVLRARVKKYPRRMRINEVIEKYFEENPPDRTWFRTVKTLFDHYVTPRYGGYWLAGIGHERWMTLIETATLDKPSRGINLHKTLRSFLYWAVRRGLLQANPLSRTKVEIPVLPDPPEPQFLKSIELCAVWRAAQGLGEPWFTMLGLLILTGEAMEHIRQIQSNDIDWDQGLWSVERRVAPNWTVRLSPEAIELLLPYRNRQGYFFRSPRSDFPINFYTEIIERLRTDIRVPAWEWGLRDIRSAVRSEIAGLGEGPDAVLQWSKNFAAARDQKVEDDECNL
jgi:integrase